LSFYSTFQEDLALTPFGLGGFLGNLKAPLLSKDKSAHKRTLEKYFYYIIIRHINHAVNKNINSELCIWSITKILLNNQKVKPNYRIIQENLVISLSAVFVCDFFHY